MAFIDGTVVNVALPALQWSLKATVVDVQWVVEAYSLLLASFLLVGGSLGDHYGRWPTGPGTRCSRRRWRATRARKSRHH